MTAVARNLADGVTAGEVLPGDVLLGVNGERGLLNAGIRYAQRRALRDLLPWWTHDDAIAEAARYTHAAQVLAVWADGSLLLGEQVSPHARMRMSTELAPGQRLLVKRLRGATRERVAPVIAHWHAVCDRRAPYPARELVYYWLKWVRKTWLAQHFADLFLDCRHNVCSGEVVWASQYGGWFGAEPPEAWYPARLAVDRLWTETVGLYEVGGSAPATPPGRAEALPGPSAQGRSPLAPAAAAATASAGASRQIEGSGETESPRAGSGAAAPSASSSPTKEV